MVPTQAVPSLRNNVIGIVLEPFLNYTNRDGWKALFVAGATYHGQDKLQKAGTCLFIVTSSFKPL